MEILKLNLNQTKVDSPSAGEIRFHIALVASAASTAVALVLRFALDAPLVPELLAQEIFAVAPIWAVELAVGLLGPFAKHLAFLAGVLAYGLALIGLAIGFLKLAERAGSWRVFARRVALLSTAAFAVTELCLIPALAGGFGGTRLRQGVLATFFSQLVICAVYGAVIMVAFKLYAPSADSAVGPQLISRRRVIRGVGYSVLLVGVYDIGKQLIGSWFLRGSGRVRGGDGMFPNIENLALEVTPTRDFYEVSKNAFDPDVDSRRWRLEVGGLVENPISMDYEQLRQLPSVEQYATLACISNEVGGDLIGNALWRGVQLKNVLELVGLKSGVVDILLRAADDYTDSIPLDRAMAEGTLLVYEMNGAPLTSSHGFPVRLLVPGIYGMKNVKWLKRIEAVDIDFKGYWQRRGWNDRAEYKTLSRIDAPTSSSNGEVTIAGIAFAGDRGIDKVEVSTDGGRNWQQAEIKAPASQYSWVLWQRRWVPDQPGKHRLVVRAVDGRGEVQTSQVAPPEPEGSSGYHSKIVNASPK